MNRKRNKKRMNEEVKFVIVSGVAGSGKTTIGKKIARELGYVYLDKDTMSRDFVELALSEKNIFTGDRECDYYTGKLNPVEYKSMIDTGIENIELGHSVVLSAPFMFQLLGEEGFSSITSKFRSDLNINLKVVYIYTDIETGRIRIFDRGADRDEWKRLNWAEYESVVKDVMKKVEQINDKHDYIFMFDNSDSTRNLDYTLNEVIQWIQE